MSTVIACVIYFLWNTGSYASKHARTDTSFYVSWVSCGFQWTLRKKDTDVDVAVGVMWKGQAKGQGQREIKRNYVHLSVTLGI